MCTAKTWPRIKPNKKRKQQQICLKKGEAEKKDNQQTRGFEAISIGKSLQKLTQ